MSRKHKDISELLIKVKNEDLKETSSNFSLRLLNIASYCLIRSTLFKFVGSGPEVRLEIVEVALVLLFVSQTEHAKGFVHYLL